MAQTNLSLEEAQRLVKESGSKIRSRTVRSTEYVWRCPNPRCKHHKLAEAIKGSVPNWVILNAGNHLLAEQKQKVRRQQLKKQDELMIRGEN